jgi:hypothetical protein
MLNDQIFLSIFFSLFYYIQSPILFTLNTINDEFLIRNLSCIAIMSILQAKHFYIYIYIFFYVQTIYLYIGLLIFILFFIIL